MPPSEKSFFGPPSSPRSAIPFHVEGRCRWVDQDPAVKRSYKKARIERKQSTTHECEDKLQKKKKQNRINVASDDATRSSGRDALVRAFTAPELLAFLAEFTGSQRGLYRVLQAASDLHTAGETILQAFRQDGERLIRFQARLGWYCALGRLCDITFDYWAQRDGYGFLIACARIWVRAQCGSLEDWERLTHHGAHVQQAAERRWQEAMQEAGVAAAVEADALGMYFPPAAASAVSGAPSA